MHSVCQDRSIAPAGRIDLTFGGYPGRLELSGSMRTDDLVLRAGGEIATRRDLANRRGLHSTLAETIPS